MQRKNFQVVNAMEILLHKMGGRWSGGEGVQRGTTVGYKFQMFVHYIEIFESLQCTTTLFKT